MWDSASMYPDLITITNNATQQIVFSEEKFVFGFFSPTVDLLPGAYTLSVHSQDGVNIGQAATLIFTVAAPPVPQAVTNLQPANGGSIVQDQLLTWDLLIFESVEFSYEVEISSDSNFTNPIVQASNILGPSYGLDGLALGGYYWRVRGVNHDGVKGPWTTAQITVTAAPPTKPTLVSVTKTETGRPRFEWQAVNGHAVYQLEVNEVCGDGTPLYQVTVSATTHEIPANAQRLYQGNYLYCVKAAAQGSYASQPFQVNYSKEMLHTLTTTPFWIRTFNIAPEAGQTITYKITIDDETTFTPPYTYETPLYTAKSNLGYWYSYQNTYYPPSGVYYWRVDRYINGVAEPVHSLVYSKMYVGYEAPRPALTSPNKNAVVNGPVLLTWNPSVKQPTYGTITHYRLKIYNHRLMPGQPAFEYYTFLVDQPQEFLFVPPAGIDHTQFTWDVEGYMGVYEATGNITYQRSFYVDMVAPAAPVVTWPTPEMVTELPRPTFKWNAATGAEKYQVQVLDAATQAELVNVEVTKATLQSTPSINLLNGSYIFRIRAKDFINMSDWVSVSFTVQDAIPPPVETLKPANLAIMKLAEGLSWGPITNASGGPFTYDVQISNNADFTTLFADPKGLTETFYIPENTIPSATYYWRVRGVNPMGEAGFWSTAQLVVLDFTPLAAPGVSTSLSNTATGRPALQWYLVSEAVAYVFEVNEVCSDGSPLITKRVTGTSYTMSAADAALPQGEWLLCVKSEDYAGNLSAFGSKPFTVLYNSSPSDNASAPLSGYLFVWNSVAALAGETITYKLIIDSENTFDAPYIYESPMLDYHSDTVARGVPPGKYYWRVIRFVDGVADPLLTTKSFAVTYTTALPTVAPQIPVNNASINTASVTLTWAAPTPHVLHTDYHIQVYRGATSVVDAIVPVESGRQYTATLPTLDNVTYHWRVSTLNAGHRTSSYGPFFTFTVDTIPPDAPSITWPTPDTVTNQPRPTFVWTPIADAQRYTLQILNSETQAVLVTTQVNSPAVSSILPSNLINGNYIFRVSANDGANDSAWASASFRIQDAVPPPITDLQPVDNGLLNAVQNLSWYAINDASGMPFTYEVQISANLNFSPLAVAASGLTEATYRPSPFLPDGLYWWRVRSVNNVGVRGIWAVQSMTLDRTPLAAPLPNAPTSLSTGRPLLSWSSVKDSTRYELEVNEVCDDGSPLLSKNVTGTSYQMSISDAPLLQGDYVYCIRSVDAALNVSPYSVPRPFTVLYNLSPSNNTSFANGTLSWSAVPGLTGQTITYQVQLDDEPTFAQPLVHEIITSSTLTTIQALPTIRLYWRVIRLVNGVADPILTSQTFTFTQTAEGQRIPLLTPAANTAINTPTVTLMWSQPIPATTLTNYRVDVYQGTTHIVSELVSSSTLSYVLSLPANQNNITYHWRVVALYNTALRAYSSFTSFIIDDVVPDAPTITAPMAGAELTDREIIVTWSAGTDAQTYEIEILNTSTQAVVTSGQTSAQTTTYTSAALLNDSYVVRVRSKDSVNASEWATLPFRVNSSTPDPTPTPNPTETPQTLPAPIITSPAENAVITTALPTITWTNPAGSTAVRYLVELNNVCGDGSPTYDSIADATPISSTSYTLLASLPVIAQGKHQMCVRAVNAEGVISAYSASRTVTYNPLYSPQNILYNSTSTVSLRVLVDPTIANAETAYVIQVDTEPTFAPPLYHHVSVPAGIDTGVLVGNQRVVSTNITIASTPTTYYWRAMRSQAGVVETPTSPVSAKFYSGTLPLGPTLYANPTPVMKSTQPFAWTVKSSTGIAVEGYVVRLATDNSFINNLITVYVEGQNTNSVVVPLPPNLSNVTYYWQVAAITSDRIRMTQWSATGSRIIDDVAPAAPAILSPTNNETLFAVRPMFQWAVLDATGYRFAVKDLATEIDVIDQQTTSRTFTPATDLAVGTYELRVSAYDTLYDGPWTTVTFSVVGQDAALAVPALLTPANAVTLTDAQPTFTWEAVSGAITYTIQIDDAADFAAPQVIYVTSTSHIPSPALPLGSYYWRVRTLASAGTQSSGWSEPRTFTLNSVALSAPILVAPYHAANIITQPTFSWGVVKGAQEYKLQIDPASDFSAPTLVTVSTPSYTPDPVLTTGTYYWRAAAVIDGYQSNWSHARQFTIHPPVVTTTLISPADNSLLTLPGTTAVMPVTFKWSAVSGAGYTLQLAADPSFATIENSCFTTSLSCTLSGMSAGRYIWRVLVNNAPYGESAWITVSPVAPRAMTLVSPINGRYLLPAERPETRLTWSWGGSGVEPTGAPFTYQVEVSRSNTFGTLTVSGTDLLTPRFTTPALADGTYYWRARGINTYGVPGAWSTTFSFIIDSVASFTLPVISEPAANAIMLNTRVQIRWSHPLGANRYTIEINDVCDDGTPVLLTGGAITSYLNLPVLPQGTYVICMTTYDLSDNKLTTEPRPFSIALGHVPTQGAFIASTVKPRFEWASAYEAGKTFTYQIQIDPTGDFAGADLLTSNTVNATSLIWPTTLPVGSYQWRVVRFVNGVADPAHTLSWTLFIGALTQGPALLAPDTSAAVGSPITLAWAASSAGSGLSIDEYEVVVSRNTSFSTTDFTQRVAADVLSIVFTPTTLYNRMTHYWRVRGLSSGLPVTNWSTRTFIVDSVAPAAPLISVPAANSLANTVRPTITWQAISGVSQYRVVILDADTLDPLVTPQVLTGTSYTPNVNLPQDTLIAQVEASDGVNWSTASRQTFSVRLGTAPGQNGVVTINRPAFSWIAVPGATGYTVQVDNNIDFSSPLFTATVTTPSYTPTAGQALTAGIYVWRVKTSTGEYPAGAAARTFIYGTILKPLTPVVASGLTSNTPDTVFNANEAATLVFSWRSLTPAPLRYEVQISNNVTFPTVSTVTRTSLTSSLELPGADVTDGFKIWRVRGIYSEDTTGYGPWSDAKTFTLDRVAPLPPILNMPNIRVTTARPTFTWFSSVNVARYILTVIDRSTNQPVPGLEAVLTTNLSYTVPASLRALKQSTQGYDWSVQAEDWAGNRSSTALAYRFSVAVMVAPASGQFVADSTPAFSWTGIAGLGAAQWLVEIYRETNSGERTLIYTSPTLPSTSTSFTLPNVALLQPGRYSWRVFRPTEDTLTLDNQTFYIVPTLTSVIPKQLTPISGQLLRNTASLTWQPLVLSGPLSEVFSGYEVQLSLNSTFPATSVMKHFTTETNLPLSGLTLVDGIYYWRVVALFSEGSARPSSSLVRSFQLDNTAPGIPLLNIPVANAILIDSTPTMTWFAASGTPVEYILQIENDPASMSEVYTAAIKAPTLTHTLPNASALKNGRYMWRVLAKDAAGNVSVVTSGRPLTIAAP